MMVVKLKGQLGIITE